MSASARPLHTPRRSARRTAALVGAPVLALSLAGCGAGFQANTYLNRNLDDAANSDVGRIALRNVYVASPDEGIEHPAGSDAELQLTIANNSPEPDELVSVRTDAAQSTAIVLDGRRLTSLELTPNALSDPELAVELTELTRPIRAGELIDVTFRFERNGERTFQVPIGSPVNPEEPEHSEKLHGEKKE